MIKLEGVRKIFMLGDLHLGVKNNSMEWSDIQTSFLLDFFLKKVDEEGFDPATDILIQVGDWNHVRESTNVRIHNLSLEIAYTLCQKFTRGVYVILGNHDVYYKDRTDTHSLKGYDMMFNNFYVYEEPNTLEINSHKFLMLPWIEKTEELKTAAHIFTADYLVCHADIQGFVLNAATRITHGLQAQDLKKFKRVYSGHIHIRQEKGNVLYVGTPYEMDRGDRNNTKGFYVLNVSGKKVTEKFIENTHSPKHIKLDAFELLELSKSQIKELFHNNFIDISIESEFSKKFPIAQFTELISEFGQRRLEFLSYSKELVKSKSEVEINSNYEYNIFAILEEHLKNPNIPAHLHQIINDKFKSIYDSLYNSKDYDQ